MAILTIQPLAFVAEVLGAINASEPLPRNPLDTSVAKGRTMADGLEIR